MHILVLDSAITQLDIVSDWTALRWTRGWNVQGGFELSVHPDDARTAHLTTGNILFLDQQHIGMIESVDLSRKENGDTLTITGCELKDIIKRRITVPPAASASGYDVYNNKTPEYIVRALLQKHVISPEASERGIPNTALSENHDYGNRTVFSTRYANLQDEIYSLLSVDGLGFGVGIDFDNRQIVFDILQGVDRSVRQNANSRAMFRLSHGTLLSYEQSNDVTAYKNTAYIGGQGEGTERQVLLMGDDNAGWERSEMFVDARDINDTDALVSRGNEKLSEADRALTLSVEVDPNNNMEYTLGDVVSVYDEINREWIDQRVVQTNETFNAGSPYNLEVTLGVVPMSIGSAVSRKISSETADTPGTNDIFNLFYPVGAIYETFDADFDPNNAWGGTWERVKGKVLVGVDEDDADFNTVKKTGGEKVHILTIDEMPSHTHTQWSRNWTVTPASSSNVAANAGKETTATGSAGGGQAHNNMQPYTTCYIWTRTA